MKKKIFTLVGLAAVAALTVTGVLVSSKPGSFTTAGNNCAVNGHNGNHYSGYAATKLEHGIEDCYVCCECHEVLLASEYTPGGNDVWAEAGQEPTAYPFEKTSKAYIEPTITKEEVITEINKLGSVGTKDYSISFLDMEETKVASSYIDAYLTKSGAKEEDITNLSTLENAETYFSHYEMSRHKLTDTFLYPSGGYNRALGTPDGYFGKAENFVDDLYGNGIKYTLTGGQFPAWQWPYKFFGGFFVGRSGTFQFAMRTSADAKFNFWAKDSAGSNHNSTAFTTKANEWQVITMPEDFVSVSIDGYDYNYNGGGLSAQVSLDVGFVMEITDVINIGYNEDESVHSYSWETLSDPTPSEPGIMKGTCDVCGFETTREIALGAEFVDSKITTVQNEVAGGINVLALPTYKHILEAKELYDALPGDEQSKVTKLGVLNNLLKYGSEFYVSDSLTSLFDMSEANIAESGSTSENFSDPVFGTVKKHNLINGNYFAGTYTHLFELANVGGTEFTSNAVLYVYSTVDAMVRAKTVNNSGSGSGSYALKIQLVKNKWNTLVLSKELMQMVTQSNGFELQSTKALTYNTSDYILVSDFYATSHMNPVASAILSGATNAAWCARIGEYQKTIENVVSITPSGSNNDLGMPFFQGNVQNTDPGWHYVVKYENISGKELTPSDLVGSSRVLGINFDSSTDLIGKGATGIYLPIWCSHDIEVKSSKALGSYSSISDSDLDELGIGTLHAGWNFIAITDAATLAMFEAGSKWVPTVSIIPASLPAGFTAYYGAQPYFVAE